MRMVRICVKRLKGIRDVKRVFGLLVLVFIVVFALVGCGRDVKKADSDSKITVYTSFYPMYDFTKKVGGDRVNVVNLVPPGMEPHDWEPAPTDIANLDKANVLVYSGAGMEHWVDKVVKSLKNDKLVLVEASKGVTLLQGHKEEHPTPQVGETHGAQEGMDPHVWLDPMNGKKQMEAIKNGLVQADPKNADYYEANYKKYRLEFDKLDKEFKETLSPLTRKEMIVSHQAFSYLAGAYGLTQKSIRGISPDEEPDPAKMGEIIRFAKEYDVKVIFFEEMVSPKIAETIARETGAKVMVLSPLENLTNEQVKAGDDYFSVMRRNLAALKAALE